MNEPDNEVTVGVAVLSGAVSGQVVVRFDTVDDSATSTGESEKFVW